jgi:hypothetical protein
VTDQQPPDEPQAGSPSAGDPAAAHGPRHASDATAPAGLTVLRAGAHRAPASRRTRLLVSIAALAVVVLMTVLLLRPGTADRPTDAVEFPGGESTRAELVRWAAAELPADMPVLVPDDLLDELSAADDRFRALDADAPDSLLLVTGQPPRGSVVLARLADPDGTELTVVDPTPGQPTPDELKRRQRLSAAILANPNTGATGRAAEVLTGATVDARLLGLLAVLVAQLGVGVSDFPPAPGEPTQGPLARHVLLDRVGDERVAPGEPAADRLLAFLAAQLPPFAPDAVEVTDGGILVGFRYESAPDALVTANTP